MARLTQSTFYIAAQAIFAAIFLGSLDSYEHHDLDVISTFLVIGGMAIVFGARALTIDAYSVRLIFWFFTYWFSFLIPLASYMTGRWWYGDMSVISKSYIIKGNLLIILFSSLFAFAYFVSRKTGGRVLRRWRQRIKDRFCISASTGVMVAVSICSTIILFITLKTGLFFRAVLLDQNGVGRPVFLVLTGILRPLVLMCFLVSLYQLINGTRKNYFSFGIIAISFVITNFPTAMARYYLFAVIFGLAVIVVLKFKITKIVSLSILWGGTFIAYLLHPLRYIGIEYHSAQDVIDAYRRSGFTEYFFGGHYAAYEIFITGLEMLNRKGYVFGTQLLATLASWVPRSIWPGKPEHTGKLVYDEGIAQISGSVLENISAPVYLESIVDFGILGLVMFAILLGWGAGRFDFLFYSIRNEVGHDRSCKNGAYWILYCLLAPFPALTFLFWRGSWMPAFGYLGGASLAAIFLWLVLTKPRQHH